MKIGIDAKWYFTGPVSTQTVLQNLLPRLLKFYPTHEWFVFMDENDRHFDIPFSQKNVSVEYVWAKNNMLSNVFILPKFARKLNIDIMVFQTFPSLMRNTKSVAFIHDVLFRDYPRFFTWKERLYFVPLPWLTRKATRLIATTQYVATSLVRHGYAKNRTNIDIVPLAVSADFKPLDMHDPRGLQAVREKYQLPEKFLLFVGRLNVRKNIENLLKALLDLPEVTIPLVIIGKEDWKTPNLKMLLSNPRLQEKIMIHRRMNNEELAATYAMSTVFCFPSFAEGFGLPPLEAMASGVPAVISNSTALTEVCGSAATYIDPADPATIAHAIKLLLTDPKYYANKRNAGLKQAAQYNWDESAHAFMRSITNSFNGTSS